MRRAGRIAAGRRAGTKARVTPSSACGPKEPPAHGESNAAALGDATHVRGPSAHQRAARPRFAARRPRPAARALGLGLTRSPSSRQLSRASTCSSASTSRSMPSTAPSLSAGPRRGHGRRRPGRCEGRGLVVRDPERRADGLGHGVGVSRMRQVRRLRRGEEAAGSRAARRPGLEAAGRGWRATVDRRIVVEPSEHPLTVPRRSPDASVRWVPI